MTLHSVQRARIRNLAQSTYNHGAVGQVLEPAERLFWDPGTPAALDSIRRKIGVPSLNNLVFRELPEKTQSSEQLLDSFLGVQRAILSLSFADYPTAFGNFYSALEKLCRHVGGLDKKPKFFEAYQAAGEALDLSEHRFFERDFEKKHAPFVLLQGWSDLRNTAEHDSFESERTAEYAEYLLCSIWPAYDLICEAAFGMNLTGRLRFDVADALIASQSVARTVRGARVELESDYFMAPLISAVRIMLRPNFEQRIVHEEDVFRSGLRDDLVVAWRDALRREKTNAEWSDEHCPLIACREPMAQLGLRDVDDGTNVFVSFHCPECNLSIWDHAVQPYLAEAVLRDTVNRRLRDLSDEFGPQTIRWR